jgi:hypothetical protein
MRHKIERCWAERAKNGKYWICNQYGRITKRTVTADEATAMLAFINAGVR